MYYKIPKDYDMKIIEFYNDAIFINYWQIYRMYFNKYFKEVWHSQESWFIKIGFEYSWFDVYKGWYDGNTLNTLTLCGVVIGYGYRYVAKPIGEDLK